MANDKALLQNDDKKKALLLLLKFETIEILLVVQAIVMLSYIN